VKPLSLVSFRSEQLSSVSSSVSALQMSFASKVVVVFGATGVVGSGAANAFLNADATVIAVGRDMKKLEELKGNVEKNANLHLIVGDYVSEEGTKQLHETIKAKLNGKEIDRTPNQLSLIIFPFAVSPRLELS
jgi:NAD(P)-dependent dehydrogenase (short-subunit alcohol dehydrogenase family)